MVVFFHGCPIKCIYCHNSTLWKPKAPTQDDLEKLKAALLARRSFLDGVVFSGGEPLCHAQILTWVQELKRLDIRLSLHTSGLLPDRLYQVLPYINWVGLDFKCLPNWEPSLLGISIYKQWLESISHVLDSSCEFETRTTLWPEHHTEDHLWNMLQTLGELTLTHRRNIPWFWQLPKAHRVNLTHFNTLQNQWRDLAREKGVILGLRSA